MGSRWLLAVMLIVGCKGGSSVTPDGSETCAMTGESCADVACCDTEFACLARAGDPTPRCRADPLCLASTDACTQISDCCSESCEAGQCSCAEIDLPCDPDSGVAECCTGLVCDATSFRCELALCSASGVPCSVPEECCEHLTCVAESCSCGMQSSPCETALDCCDGLVCFPNAGCQLPE